jgi:hypothetical protein
VKPPNYIEKPKVPDKVSVVSIFFIFATLPSCLARWNGK